MRNLLKSPLALALCIFLVTAAGVMMTNFVSVHPPESRMIDISALKPGAEMRLYIGAHVMIVSVPEQEGASIGTMQIEIPDLSFASPKIERDGSPESVWIADVSGDGSEDAVFVIRSAGSGGYVSILVLESTGKTFRVRNIPEVSIVSGYRGHEEITVRDKIICCTFPTYVDRSSPRIDRQWEPKDAVSGEFPVKSKPDSNADPSGATKILQFDYAAWAWKKGYKAIFSL